MELQRVASGDVRIGEDKLRRCQLPDPVITPAGITGPRPAPWRWPFSSTGATMPQDPRELRELRDLLRTLFQLDEAEDLDFGMYRVLRLRREELRAFLDRTLAETVAEAMGSVTTGDRAAIEEKMRSIEEQAARFGGKAGADPDYRELKARLDAAGDAVSRERQVYAHLGEFLSRYYVEGDFLALPRLGRAGSPAPYAIPYDGSEVVLHWANKDQYYVKSGEFFARCSTSSPAPAPPATRCST
jgi:adenine-specific DNA-methyltransferase